VTNESVATAAKLLEVDGLSVEFATRSGARRVVDGLGFSLARGGALGIVGESGSGKSVTSLALMGLLADNARVVSGRAVFAGRDLLRLDESAMRGVRGAEISMIFQDPMTSLNPSYTIGFQLRESLRLHGRGPDGGALDRSAKGALDAAAETLLAQVGIPEPRERLGSYPHQLSGGMSQRAMIAMAIACRPKLLIADEPTTALDVTIQAQILDLLRSLRVEREMALILITHDIGVVAETADEILVMRHGQLIELGPARGVVENPTKPYTRALLECLPARHALKEFRTRLPTVGLAE
jgi:dipeptide transport system ATP-binding protein